MNVKVVEDEWMKEEVEIGHKGGNRKNGGNVAMQGRRWVITEMREI